MRERKFLFLLVFLCLAFFINACSSSTTSISIKPNGYNFGDVETSASVTFTIKNNTKEVVSITSISFTGTDAGKFAVTSGGAPFDLQPKGTSDVEVEFTPKTYGPKEAEMVIDTSYVKKPTITKRLKGYGYVAAFNPADYDFGTIDVGQSTSTNFNFVNDLERDITVTSFDITGTNIADYTITAGTPSTVPANGGAIQVSVEFAPTTHGQKVANLTATTTDGTFGTIHASLTGEGNVDIIETFDNTTMADTAVTTAEWGTVTAGELTPTGLSSFGTGADGAYNPTASGNLDADAGPYNYTSINIPAGVVITVTGTQALEILCQGDVVIAGELNLDGKDGGDAIGGAAGIAGAGGHNGGAYKQNGSGPGAGMYSSTGGGAGYAMAGQSGTQGGSGGVQYGSADLSTIDGGSGGGGGTDCGGGGGGGAVSILAGGNIEIAGDGLITANGGWGGGNPGGVDLYYGGGGGSGGAVKLQSAADIMFTGGSISVQGGGAWEGASQANKAYRGGFGSPGRVRLEDADGSIQGVGGSIFPIPSAAVVSTPFTGGTGSDGAFNPTSNITLDTSAGPFNYTSINIPSGVTVKAIGSNPLEIYCTGDIIIAGTIDVSGGNATNTALGVGVAGGADGGAIQSDGAGAGGGKGHASYAGSGGGFGEKGQNGYRNTTGGGIVNGSATLNPLTGGSGGGGGRVAPGAAGGGAVRLQSAGLIEISGEIISNGGDGFAGTLTSYPGAGGSGGGILIQGNTLDITGHINARGGLGGARTSVGTSNFTIIKGDAHTYMGGWGGHGRIRIESLNSNAGGIVMSTQSRYMIGGSRTILYGSCSIATITAAGLVGQSKFFDTTLTAPTWQNANITGTDLTQVKVVFQSADDDGNGNPDPLTYTAWYDTLTSLPQKQHIRFRVYFKPGSGSPAVDEIEILFD